MAFIVGVDIGGTFTDATAVSMESGKLLTTKSRTTPHDLVEGVRAALEELARDAGLGLAEFLGQTVRFSHGTTQTSNVMFTWEGAKTGVVTTRGFADELLIMRAIGRVAGLSLTERRHLRATDKPRQIVPSERIVEVDERVDGQGRVVLPLDEQSVERAINELIDRGVEAIAVSLLWAPRNPDHELRIRQLIHDRSPEMHVTLSHEVAPVIGEYERVSTAAVNAFVAPTLDRYLRRLEDMLHTAGLRVPLLVLQASAGVVRADEVTAVHTIESGPAAGLIAASQAAEHAGQPNVIATDVGGTTFKVGLVSESEIRVTQDTIINQYSLLMPMVELVSIGAGGGSIAWVDGQRLRIGPRSAGSDPGPACYGWGGTEPTVTDADVVLGFLAPENFIGGRMPLYPELARKSFQPLADALFDGDVVAAAAGVRTIVDSQMGDLVRKATIERGLDPRDFVLYAYGGAGPLHAAGYSRDIGVEKIVIPVAATVFSSYGAAVADLTTTRLRAAPSDALAQEQILEQLFLDLEHEARGFLEVQDDALEAIQLSRWAEMRYSRQLHDVRVTIPSDLGLEQLRSVIESSFLEEYGRLYGQAAILPDTAIDVLRVGVDATGLTKNPPIALNDEPIGEVSDDQALGHRDVYWPESSAWLNTVILQGERLETGDSIQGPALIERMGTTIAIPPESAALVDDLGNVVLKLGKTGVTTS